MPTDVTLFDMLEQGQLEGMTTIQLHGELERIKRMRDAVDAYEDLVFRVKHQKKFGSGPEPPLVRE